MSSLQVTNRFAGGGHIKFEQNFTNLNPKFRTGVGNAITKVTLSPYSISIAVLDKFAKNGMCTLRVILQNWIFVFQLFQGGLIFAQMLKVAVSTQLILFFFDNGRIC